MDSKLKKEVFLCLLEILFSDRDERITENNCIDFYHHLLDELEREMIEKEDNDDNMYFTYRMLIYVFSRFEKFDYSYLFSLLSEKQNFIDLVNYHTNMRCGIIKKDLVLITGKYTNIKEQYFA